jgi:hypothetical protein
MIAMNNKQKIILWLGIIVFVAAGFYPPWYVKAGAAPEDLGYRVLFSPPIVSLPNYTGRVDFDRLGMEWAIIAVITGTLLLVYASGKEKTSHAPDA